MLEEQLAETSLQVVMTQAPTTKINGVLLGMGIVWSFLELRLCVDVDRRIVVEILYILLTKKNKQFFAYLVLTLKERVFINKWNTTLCALAFLTFWSFQIASTTTATGSNSKTHNDTIYIKYSVALAGLNKLETQSMNPHIAELANVFCIIFNIN